MVLRYRCWSFEQEYAHFCVSGPGVVREVLARGVPCGVASEVASVCCWPRWSSLGGVAEGSSAALCEGPSRSAVDCVEPLGSGAWRLREATVSWGDGEDGGRREEEEEGGGGGGGGGEEEEDWPPTRSPR